VFTLIDFCEKAASESFVITLKIRVGSFGNLRQYAVWDDTFGNPETLVIELSKHFGPAIARRDFVSWNIKVLQIVSAF
jgi:hypothetical protein